MNSTVENSQTAKSKSIPGFRDVMSRWPTGVSVVGGKDSEGRSCGMVIGSLTSVSMDPPLLAFCPMLTSKTWTSIKASGRFIVNILAHDQADLCKHFSKTEHGKRFDGIDCRLSESDLPIINNSVAYIELSVRSETMAGDHTIVVAAVENMQILRNVSPLVFCQGKLSSAD